MKPFLENDKQMMKKYEAVFAKTLKIHAFIFN